MIGQQLTKDTMITLPPKSTRKVYSAVIHILLFSLLLFSLFTLNIVRMFMFVVFLISAVVSAVVKKYQLFAASLCYMAVIFCLYWYPCYVNWEILRFHFVRGAYENQVEKIRDDPSVQNTEDLINIFTQERSDARYFFLSQSGKYEYKKIGDSILIYFPTRATFFDEEGYIYFSDEKMKDYLEHPNEYNPTFLEKGYKSIKYYDSNWAYIIRY